MAQLVERPLPKLEVCGSNPVIGEFLKKDLIDKKINESIYRRPYLSLIKFPL